MTLIPLLDKLTPNPLPDNHSTICLYTAIATLVLYSAYKLGTWAGEFCANLSIEV